MRSGFHCTQGERSAFVRWELRAAKALVVTRYMLNMNSYVVVSGCSAIRAGEILASRGGSTRERDGETERRK